MKAVRVLGPAALAVLFLVQGCGSSSPTAPTTPPPPQAPSGVSFTVSPGGTAITGVTFFQYAGTATGTGLTYAWKFGDGTTASGPTATHLYLVSGSYNVVLTVTNSSGSATAANISTARSISGDWASPINGNGFSWTFSQNGRNFTGLDTSLRPDAHLVHGVLTNPRQVTFEEGNFDFVFTGTVEKGLDSMDLTFQSPDGPQNVRIVRQ
jgi:hypothetical protein